jgi:hypothetical protein
LRRFRSQKTHDGIRRDSGTHTRSANDGDDDAPYAYSVPFTSTPTWYAPVPRPCSAVFTSAKHLPISHVPHPQGSGSMASAEMRSYTCNPIRLLDNGDAPPHRCCGC